MITLEEYKELANKFCDISKSYQDLSEKYIRLLEWKGTPGAFLVNEYLNNVQEEGTQEGP